MGPGAAVGSPLATLKRYSPCWPTAFNDYWAGVDHAKANPRGVAYPTTSAAAGAGVSDYWTGVDYANANPHANGAPPGNAAAVEGATDLWFGENQALTTLVALRAEWPPLPFRISGRV